MRILLINPNTTKEMTATMRAGAELVAAPGTEIVATEVAWGAPSIESHYEGYISAAGVLDLLTRLDPTYDAVIMAGFGEPGREAAQELMDIPVLDITDSAAHVACLLGRRFSVITTVRKAIGQIEDRLALAGVLGRCSSVRATGLGVLELELNLSATETIISESLKARDQDGAEVIILGCGGMAGLAERVAERTGLPVIDGIAAAVGLAEAIHRQGLKPSKHLSFEEPPAKTMLGWPIPV